MRTSTTIIFFLILLLTGVAISGYSNGIEKSKYDSETPKGIGLSTDQKVLGGLMNIERKC